MKRIITLLASAALVASGLSIVPAAAQETPVIPGVANIEDPTGDANYLNDQGVGNGVDQDDHVTPADVGSFSDIMKVWFSNDADTVTAHFQVQGFPGSTRASIYYIVYASPGEGSAASSSLGCVRFVGILSGATYAQSSDEAKIFDHCNEGSSYFSNGTEAEFSMVEGPDGTGIVSIKAPRDYSPLLQEGALTAPHAETRNMTGEATSVGFLAGPRIDTTKIGTDYAFVEGEAQPTPPGKNDPPGKKKGCSKGKGKKRGCEGKGKKAPKPGKPAAGCAPYAPGEMGAEAETTIVTDENTEEKPFEMEVPLGPATGTYGGDRTTRMKHNVQVDTKNEDAGLFIRLETPPLEDPDLYAYWPSGSQAAMAAGFNPLLAAGPLPSAVPYSDGLNGLGNGGHSEFTAEQIDGLRTADCQGWTLDLVNWAGRGGTYTLKVWLGEVENEPAEDGQ